jgi:hypothetical protein
MELKQDAIASNIRARCSIFLSFLAYQLESDIDILNRTNELWDGVSNEWVALWSEIKPHFNSSYAFNVFSCSDYGIGNTQFIYTTLTQSNELIVAFRGTKSVSDVLTDVRVDKDKCTDICYTPFYLKQKMQYTNNDPMVHAGFHEMYGLMKYAVIEVVETYLKGDHKKEIIFTGHSLGGAVSILATSCMFYGCDKLHNNNDDTSVKNVKIFNITFGSPKVGNYDFSTVYNKLVSREYIHSCHYFHNSDPVPCLPILSGFYPCQQFEQINQTNESKLYSVRYHIIECYLKHLNKLK